MRDTVRTPLPVIAASSPPALREATPSRPAVAPAPRASSVIASAVSPPPEAGAEAAPPAMVEVSALRSTVPTDAGFDRFPIQPRLRPGDPPLPPPPAESPAEPVIEVRIGRLEWRPQAPSTPPPAAPAAARASGFAAYAALRAGIDRGRR